MSERDPAISAMYWRRVIIESLRLAAASEPSDIDGAIGRYFEALSDAMRYDAGSMAGIREGHEAFRVDLEDEGWPSLSNALIAVGDNALRYLADRASSDPAAQGREARRRDYLRNAITNIEHAAEARRRKR